ncbi:MAG: TraM recognition domain-containing protein, partial [Candidatus Moranbacteria bacterium]|nr:TraM recognition domain-containing protein [Candidatus Moranbacteria bacterium]
LINLSKGKIGELNANLLGMVLVGKILMYAMSRVDIPEDQRKDFYLYIDEFQNVTTDSIASILSEARKYKLNLIIGHQFIQQLDEKIRDAVFGNVGSMVTFRIGATDAEYMVKQFAPTFNERDLINVDNYKAFVKLMINGAVSEPFSIRTLPPVPEKEKNRRKIIQYSRLKYGRDRRIVEKELKERLKLADKSGFDDFGGGSPIDSDMPVK